LVFNLNFDHSIFITKSGLIFLGDKPISSLEVDRLRHIKNNLNAPMIEPDVMGF
jgi:hypothetical protein